MLTHQILKKCHQSPDKIRFLRHILEKDLYFEWFQSSIPYRILLCFKVCYSTANLVQRSMIYAILKIDIGLRYESRRQKVKYIFVVIVCFSF